MAAQPIAATAAQGFAWTSLPPNAPPMRSDCTTTWFFGTAITRATISWVSVGCWVELWMSRLPASSTSAMAAWVSR